MSRIVPTLRTIAIVALLAIAAQAVVLYAMGQPAICTCGYVKVWEGVVLGPGNSQHLTDWYSFSHIIHGFVFYGLLALVLPKLPVRTRLLLALGIEIGWEIIENTPMVIQHYREQALAQGYTGDSVINSVSDTVMMVIGFVMARRLPVSVTVLTAIALEVFALYMIRDSLTLNVIGLLHPIQFISDWQAAGGTQ